MPVTTTVEKDLRNARPTEPKAERKPFERPQLLRRGALPKVTTAFGGTFTP